MIRITATDLQAILDDAITTALERAMEMLERDYGEEDPEDPEDPEDREDREDWSPPGSLSSRQEMYELSPEDEAYLESLDSASPEMEIHKVEIEPDEDLDFEIEDTSMTSK